MSNSKKGSIQIHDAKRMVNNKAVMGFRVKTIGVNGEPLQISEVLNDKKAVITHLKAMSKLWDSNYDSKAPFTLLDKVVDKTKKQAFCKA